VLRHASKFGCHCLTVLGQAALCEKKIAKSLRLRRLRCSGTQPEDQVVTMHQVRRISTFHEVPKNFVQNATVAIVFDFHRGIDTASRNEVNGRAVRFGRHYFDGLQWLEIVV
jgi:hypothetical protein